MTKREEIDIAVVGAGAAGLMAAIFAGRSLPGGSTVALDGATRIGSKILIAGGGRCNVTHHAVSADDFNGRRNLLRRVLKSFDVPATRRFFEDELGVRLKQEETGKLFPVTDRAATVLDALTAEAGRVGAAIRRGWRVETIERVDGGPGRFRVSTREGALVARAVVIATGGRSVPKTGSDGAGYEMVRRLGHHVTSTFPALVPLTIHGDHWLKDLRGIAHDVEVRLRDPRGRILHRHRGSLLFTHFGLSGPVVLDVSRHWIELSRHEQVGFEVSLLPDETYETLEESIREASLSQPHAAPATLLARHMPERLAAAVVEHAAGIGTSSTLGRLSRDERKRLIRSVLELTLPVTGNRGFDYAEVTAGGVPLEEVDTATMESRLVPGLHLCGEILDVDGRIGGFNFQWAWASGRLAGIHAARSLLKV